MAAYCFMLNEHTQGVRGKASQAPALVRDDKNIYITAI